MDAELIQEKRQKPVKLERMGHYYTTDRMCDHSVVLPLSRPSGSGPTQQDTPHKLVLCSSVSSIFA
jgi:hypothetical protein